MASSPFINRISTSHFPAAIIPSDTGEFEHGPPIAIRVAYAGDVSIMRVDKTSLTIQHCQPGEIIEARALRVNITGTSESARVGLIGYW